MDENEIEMYRAGEGKKQQRQKMTVGFLASSQSIWLQFDLITFSTPVHRLVSAAK